MRLLSALFFSLVLTAGLAAAGETHTPPPGSAERRIILDAARAPLERELRQQILFSLRDLNVSGDWALLYGRIVRKDGRDLDYRNTPYQDADDIGMMVPVICMLLRRQGGVWTVLDYSMPVLSTPDWSDWIEKYGAPADIFPYIPPFG